MKKLCLLLSLIIMTSFAVSNLQAQNTVNIKLKQPPPGQLNIENLWSFTLTNNSNDNLEVYLKGTATEEKDGLIATGQTVSIIIKPKEIKNMRVSDLPKTPDISYVAKDSRYKESLIRQGKFPAGKYEICVNVYSKGTNEELGSDCLNQEVQESGILSLISPSDGDVIESKMPAIFTWSGKPGESYEIKIVEIVGNESPETAIDKNREFFSEKNIRANTFTYPGSGRKFESGKKYAWRVSSGNTKTEVWTFMMLSVYQPVAITEFEMQCTGITGKYNFVMKVVNNNTAGTNVNGCNISNTAKITNIVFTTIPVCGVPVIAYTSPGTSLPINVVNGTPVTIQGSLTVSCSITGINFTVSSQDLTCAGATAQAIQNNLTISKCSCCDGFARGINKVGITQTAGVTTFSANLTAGPNPITKVTAEMVYFYQNWNDNTCKKCVMDSRFMGNFTNGKLDDFGNGNIASPLLVSYSREIKFNSPTAAGINMTTGKSIDLSLALPPSSSLSCCADTIRFCIRFSFTNTDCITCDTLICTKIIRNSSGIGTSGGKGNDTYLSKDSKENIYISDNVSKPVCIEAKFTELDENIIEANDKKIEENVLESKDKKKFTERPALPVTSQGSIWLFGKNAGLNVSTTTPTGINGSSLVTSEGCSVMSDNSGNLLFYTDGSNVWRKDHLVMQNGTGLNGSSSATQSALIVPWPNSNCQKYFVFTVDAVENPSPPYKRDMINGFRYTIVDFTTDPNGIVDNINKNIILLSAGSTNHITPTEKLTSVSDGAGGFWVLAHGYNLENNTAGSNNFYSYHVTNLGLNTTPVVSSIGTNHGGRVGNDQLAAYAQSQMKFSHDGTLVALAVGNEGANNPRFVEIFSFNNGVVSGFVSNSGNPIKIDMTTFSENKPYGLEFSPNSNLLYVSCMRNAGHPNYYGDIFQFDLATKTNIAVSSSKQNISNSANTKYGQMQYAPNGYIYIAEMMGLVGSNVNTTLSVIKQPNVIGIGCTFVQHGQILPVGESMAGLPTVIQGEFSCGEIINQNNVNCCDNFNINVQTQSNTYWTYSTLNVNVNDLYVNISTGQNRIKRIRAVMTDFLSSYSNEDCRECNNLPFSWASFSGEILAPSTIPNTLIPHFTNYTMYNHLTSQDQREVVWVNSNELSVPPLNNVPFHFYIHLPLNPQISCCADTIKYCIKYEFTDTNCVTCDTTICYTTVLKKSGKGVNGDKEFKKEIEKYEKDFKNQIEKIEKYERKGSSLLFESDLNKSIVSSDEQVESKGVKTQNSSGQSAGIINIDVSKTSPVKITIYDIHGNEVKKVFDDYVNTGEYSFDLNTLNLPDGIYYYKSEYDNKTEYKRVLINKFVSNCNCGN